MSVLIRHRVVVRFSDCDPLGHVNNATYSTYIEEARITMWRQQAGGVGLRDAIATGGRSGVGFILARTEMDFRSPAHDGDELEVRLILEGFGRSSATYAYEIVHVATGRLVVAAKTVQVWYDYGAQKAVPLSDELKDMLSEPVRGH
jgi:acyl-CoA thioester hydrolase